ncbi:ATP F0F1 synthase subunit B, partial [bacterium]|nr:ATP F0F1 synthase subunit B [bacterium]
MKHLSALLLTLMASPALAASGPFFSLYNTNFVVTVAFIGFVALVLYLGVPKMLGKMLDARADGIRAELEEARSLREEAKALLASYEKKQAEVQAQA